MKLTLQLVVVVLNAPTKFRDNLFKFTLYNSRELSLKMWILFIVMSRAVVHFRHKRLVQANPVHASKWEKRKHVKGDVCILQFFLTLGKFQFSKRKSLIDHDDSNNINNKHQSYRLAKHQLGICITPSHLIWLFILKKRDARTFFLILTLVLEHVDCLDESRLSQVNNTPRANVFPAGVANFGKAMYRSLERSSQDTRDGFF